MSRVLVRPLNILGGSGAPVTTKFTDNFNRVDTAFGYGINWLLCGFFDTAPASFGASLGQCAIFMNSAQVGGQSVNTTDIRPRVFYPLPLLNSAVFGHDQYVQFTFVTNDNNANGIVNSGCCIFASYALNVTQSISTFGYMFAIVGSGPNWLSRIYRLVNPAVTIAVDTGAMPTIHAGDVLRLEGRNSAGVLTLTWFVNGVQQGTFSEGFTPQGWPGMGIAETSTTFGSVTPNRTRFDDYEAGNL